VEGVIGMTTKKADNKTWKAKNQIMTKKAIVEVKENKSPGKEKTVSGKTTAIEPALGKSKTIAKLAKEQGVKPFEFSKAGDNWPEEADFEEFLKAINNGRKNPREY
jgi:hypothetical protein